MRVLASDSKRSVWAMADQGVVSLGNFGINIVLAAYFEKIHQLGDYGLFGFVMELIIFLNSLQQALLVYPLTVRGAMLDRIALGRMTSMCIIITVLAWPVLFAGLVVTSAMTHTGMAAGAWAGMAMLLWQIQETLRRALMANLRFRAALLGDAVSYLGQIGFVFLLAWTGKLSLITTFQVMAITSGVAAVIQAIQVGLHDVKFNELPGFARDCWNLGRWVAFGNFSNLVVGPLFSFNFYYFAGPELLGVHYALTNLLRLTNPLTTVIGTLIMPNAARARGTGGMRAAKSVMRRFTALGGVFLIPYLGIIIIAPVACIRLAFPGGADDLIPYVWALRAAVIYSALSYLGTASGVFLNAVERGRWAFYAQLVYAIGVLIIAMPLTAKYDVLGANVGAVLAVAPLVAVHIYYINKLSDNEPAPDRLSADPVSPAAV